MNRSYLFVPADSDRKLKRAGQAGADALILDLEDSVAADAKQAAREQARGYLEGRDDAWEPEGYYETPPGQSLRMRAIVWRVNTADGPKIVYLRPWHEVPFQRWRVPDFQRELPSFRAPEYR